MIRNFHFNHVSFSLCKNTVCRLLGFFLNAGSSERAQADLHNTSLNATVKQLVKHLNDKKIEVHKLGITSCHQNQNTVLVNWPVLQTRQSLEKESRF